MTLEDVSSFFGSVFQLLLANSILGIPLLVWFVIMAIFGLVGIFIKGTKK